MAAQSLQLYLERLTADDLLRGIRRALLPVTLTPAIRLSDGTAFEARGETLTVEGFLDYFRPADQQGPLLRHPGAVVVAPVGAGKSTLFRALTWEAAQRALTEPGAPVPFYLPLGRLGDSVESMVVSALWRLGLPISRRTLREQIDESRRPLFFLLDPTPTYVANGSAAGLDQLIRDLESRYPSARWVVALRPDAALALPEPWHDRRHYLLDPVSLDSALGRLLEELPPTLRARLDHLVGSLGPLGVLVRRPLIIELLRSIAIRLPSSDGRQWVSELLLSMLERAGGTEMPRTRLLESLAALPDPETRRGLDEKQLPLLVEAGLIQRAPHRAGDGEAVLYDIADRAFEELILWIDGRQSAPVPTVEASPAPEPAEVAPGAPEPEPAPVAQAAADPLPETVVQRAPEPDRPPVRLVPADGFEPETIQPSPAPEAAPPRSAPTTPSPVVLPQAVQARFEQASDAGDVDALVALNRQLDELKAETLHQIATNLLDAGQPVEAESRVREALALVPGQWLFSVTLGTIQHRDGRHEEARVTLEESLPHAPTCGGYFALGGAYAALGWEGEAFQAYRRAHSLAGPEQAEAAARAARLAPEPAERRALLEAAIALDPTHPDWYVRLGRLREQGADREGAALSYRRALEVDGANAAAHYQLGRLLLQVDRQPAEALTHLRRATTLAPGESTWFVTLGAAIEVNGVEGAEEAYRQAIRLDPRNPAPFTALGSLLRRRGDIAAALPALKGAIALDPNLVPALVELGRLHESSGELASALTVYRRAAQLDPASAKVRARLGAIHRRLGQPDEARHWLNAALELDAHFAPAYIHLAQLEEDAGALEEAVTLYRAAMREMPESTLARFRAAIVLCRLDRAVEALPLLEQVIESEPRSAEAHWQLAEAHRDLGRFVEALAAYRQAIRLDPTSIPYLLALAELTLTMGKLDEAQRIVTRISELDSRAVAAHRLAGELALARSEPANALAAFARAIDLAPRDAALYRRIADIHRRRGDLPRALDALTQALEFAGESGPLLAELADLHEANGKVAAALAALDQAVRLTPREVAYRLQRARLLAAAGQFQKARADWLEALAQDPACGEAHFGLAQLLLDEGKRSEALFRLEEAIIGRSEPRWLLEHGRIAAQIGEPETARRSLERLLSGHEAAADQRAAAHNLLAQIDDGAAAFRHAGEAIRLHPDQARYYVTLAHLHQKEAQPRQALAQLQQAQRLAPTDPLILAELAELHEKNGNMWEASDAYRRAAQHSERPAPLLCEVARLQQELMREWTEARSTLEEAIRAQPDYAPAHRDLGALLLDGGQSELAEKALRRALALEGEDGFALGKLGDLLVRRNRDEEALPLLRRAVELEPEDAQLHHLLGLIAFRRDEPEIALLEWKEASTRVPDEPRYHRHLGRALHALGRNAEARRAWDLALQFNPTDHECHHLLGRLAQQEQNWKGAAQHFRTAIENNPSDAASHCALGESQVALGQWDAALASLRRARDLDSGEPQTLLLMAECYERMGRPVQAVERATEAAALAGDQPQYHRALGDMLSRRGDWGTAAASYTRALDLSPDDGALLIALGRCERQNGQPESAAEWFRKAVRMTPNEPLPHHLYAEALATSLQPLFLAQLAQAEYPVLERGEQEWRTHAALDAARRAAALAPRNPAYQATLAILLIMADDPNGAMDALRQVADPAEHRARFQTLAGVATLRLGESSRAQALLEQASSQDSENPIVWIALARATEDEGRLPAALAAAERALALEPEEPLFLYAVARLASLAGDLARARREMKQAINRRPEISAWHRRLGDLCIQDRAYEAALAAYDQALKSVSATDPGETAATRYARGRVLVQIGRFDEAVGEMEAAIAQYGDEPDWHAGLAHALSSHGRNPEAQRWLLRAIELAPERPDYPLLLARAQMSAGEETLAGETLRTCCERWPTHAPAWRLLGELLADRGEMEAAQETLQRALDLAPDDAATHVAIGDIYYRQGDLGRARHHFDTALALDPEQVDAYVHLGRLLAHGGRYEEAIEAYHVAMQIEPAHLKAMYYLGRTCQRIGHMPKALHHLGRLVELAPEEDWAWAALADCYEAKATMDSGFDQGFSDREQENLPSVNLTEALRAYTRAHELARQPGGYLFDIGRLLKSLHRYREAVEVLKSAVRNDPDNTDAYKLLAAVSAIAFFGGRS